MTPMRSYSLRAVAPWLAGALAALSLSVQAAEVPRAGPPAVPPDDATGDIISAYRAAMARYIGEQPGYVMPAYRAELDDALARQDMWRITALTKQHVVDLPSLSVQANWERLVVYTGAPASMAYVYADSLWTLGRKLEDSARDTPDQAESLRAQAVQVRQTAVAHALYAVAVAEVESRRCRDAEALVFWEDSVRRGQAALWDYARAMPEDRQRALLRYAHDLDIRVAPMRGPDALLCGKGRLPAAGEDVFVPQSQADRGRAQTRKRLSTILATWVKPK